MKVSNNINKSNKSCNGIYIKTTEEFNSDLKQLTSKTGLNKSEIIRNAVHKECETCNVISPEFKRDISKHLINILNTVNTFSDDKKSQNIIKKEAMDICALLNS